MLPVLVTTRPLRFTRPGRLLPWLGPALRGLLAWRLKQNVCRHSPAEQQSTWRYCTGCPHMADCPYGQTVEPDPPPSAEVFRGQEQAARPLVIASPFPMPARVRPGDASSVTLTFIGARAIAAAESAWQALSQAGADPARGLDPERTTFSLDASTEVRSAQEVELPLSLEDAPGLVPWVRVRLTSPLFLRASAGEGRRQHIENPEFGDLFRAALRTLGGLFALYDRPLPADFAGLKEASLRVQRRAGDFRTFAQPRWSNRQKSHRPLHGTTGSGEYGPVPAALLPWLEWGGKLHAGTDRVAGAGGWTVEVANET